MNEIKVGPETYPGSSLSEKSPCRDPEASIQAEELSLFYNGKAAFERIHLSIPEGCITALVGPSGCGKTSFLLCLNRLIDLIPGAQVSGCLRFSDLDVLSPGLNLIALRRRVGMVFQKPNPFPLSIRKNMILPLREHRMGNRDQQEALMEHALREVGLWSEVKDRLDSSALALSGGQQQRLCFARALAIRPEVLLLDEPCSALDPISGGVVEDLMKSLRDCYSILVVTHNLAQARRIADFTGVFWVQEGAGQLVEFGSTRQVFEEPKTQLTAAYLSGVRG